MSVSVSVGARRIERGDADGGVKRISRLVAAFVVGRWLLFGRVVGAVGARCGEMAWAGEPLSAV